MHDHSMHEMHEHHHEDEGTPKEYVKFSVVILAILLISYWLTIRNQEFAADLFMRYLMGVFFLVFGVFKLLDLQGFVTSYIGYDLIARKSIGYAYFYPFIELALSAGYFMDAAWINWPTLVIMSIGSVGVIKQLLRGSRIRCACLGTYIKLPLTTVSLVEDLSMGLMALYFIIK